MSKLGKRQLHELYYYMKLTRRLEEGIARLHLEGKVPGPVWLGTGREAVGIGVAYPMRPGDLLASSIPTVGSLLVRGVQPFEVLAHFMGRKTGPTRGRDGWIRLGDLSKGLISPGGHLATHLSVMAGVAYAAKYMEKKAVAVSVASERAMATGDFHEGINFAAVHHLPLVVVLEYGPDVSSGSSFAESRHVYERVRGYGIAGLPVDGTDVLQILQAVEAGIDRARSGKGPSLVEVRTARRKIYPLGSDSIPTPFEEELDVARLEKGVREVVETDPVVQFETFLTEHGLMDPVELGLIVERVERLMDKQIALVSEEPFPEPDGSSNGVYHMVPGAGS